MTSINDKLGLRRAGKRSMMHLPDERAVRSMVTSAVCPSCGQRGARLSKLKGRGGWLVCSWCSHSWAPPAPEGA